MSHFTKIQTKLKDIVTIKQVLKDLGYQFSEAKVGEKLYVKGYLHQRTPADLVIHISRSYDIGVKITEKGIVFVADWWGVEVSRGITEKEFVRLVTQRYSYYKAKEILKKKKYTLVEDEVKEDKTIHIKVRSSV